MNSWAGVVGVTLRRERDTDGTGVRLGLSLSSA
jgi:hypothetical protein